MADDKNKTKLTNALTTVAKPGENKGSLSRALGGAVTGVAGHKVQTVDKKTIATLTQSRKVAGEAGTMAYIIDATASRSDTWKEAQRIQSEMFKEAGKSGDLAVRLVHFSGNGVKDHGTFGSASALSSAMADVNCVSGSTQISDSVDKILTSGRKPRTIVLIGDCYEEGEYELNRAAADLAAAGIKVFAFLDTLGGKNGGGEYAFRTLAEKTGGSFQIFGQGMDLKGLCAAVATYTTGGDEALKKLADSGSKEAKAIAGSVLRLTHKPS
jgi:hypothetical protein